MKFEIPDLVKNLRDVLKTITPSKLPNLLECLEKLSAMMVFQVDQQQIFTEESSENSQFEADLQSWVETEKQNHPGNSQNIHRAQQRILRAFETEATTLNLEGLKLSSLPACIGQLSNLTELHINNNLLTYLPESIGDLTNLTKLIVNHNQLTSLPDSIGKLFNLTDLNLGLNQLTSLPDSIGQLSDLTELYIYNNKLTALPDFIGKLSRLKELYVSHNQLSSLPDFIGKLSRLKELYVSHNQLSSLPNSIGDLTNLIRLYVDYNQLTALPDSIRQLPKLRYLKYKKNYIDHLVNNSQKTQEDFEKDVSQFIQTYQHLLAQWSAVEKFGTLPDEIQTSWKNHITHLPDISSSTNQKTELKLSKIVPQQIKDKFLKDMLAIALITKKYHLHIIDPLQAYIREELALFLAQPLIQRAEQLNNSWSHLQCIAEEKH